MSGCPVKASVSMVVPSSVRMSVSRWTWRYSRQLLNSCNSICFEVLLVAMSIRPWSCSRRCSMVDSAGMVMVAFIELRNIRAVSSHGALM